MANFCDYQIRVRADDRKTALLIYASVPCLDEKVITYEEDLGKYELHFTGSCKWSVNFGVSDTWDNDDIDLSDMDDDEIIRAGENLWDYSLRSKSEAFDCEIMVHYWSEESGFDQFDRYKSGDVIKQRKIKYNGKSWSKNRTDGTFDWDTLEFKGKEGVYDESVRGEEEDAQFVSGIVNGLNALLNPFGGAYTLPDSDSAADSKIKGTDFDLYKWTFSEGKRQDGDGWSIAVPDGFEVAKSPEDRLFEIVPKGYKYKVEDAPLQLLPGEKQATMLIPQVIGDAENVWRHHPYARLAVCEVLAEAVTKHMAMLWGSSPELLLSSARDGICIVQILNTGFGTFSFQSTVLTDKMSQMLRVQTQELTGSQKESLKISISKWLETFEQDIPNDNIPDKPLFLSQKVMDDLLKDKVSSFNEAVEEAVQDYQLTLGGGNKVLSYFVENDLLTDDKRNDARMYLEKGAAVKEYYVKAADLLVTDLKKSNVSAKTLEKIYSKLKSEIIDGLDVRSWTINNVKVSVSEPETILSTAKKWDEDRKNLTGNSTAKNSDTTTKRETNPPKKVSPSTHSSSSAILALSSFEVTDDIDSLRSFIKSFTHNWFSALKESNEVIENERPTPICRYNDSRIKKLETNSENVISDYAGKLQDVMVKLDQIGDKKIAEKAPEKEIKEICNLISECFDDLHMETTVTINKTNKKFAHKIKKVYVDLSEKWGNIYSSLPSTKIKAMNKELKEKERKLEEIKKNVSAEKRRRTILGKNIEKAEKDVETAKKAYDDESKAFEDRKAEYDSCVALLNSEVSDISDEIQQLEKDFSGAEEKKATSAKEFSEKISSNEKELNKLNEKLRTLKNEREIISGEEKLKREKAESAILFKKKKQQEYDEVSGRLAEKDKVVSECEKEKSDLDAQISQLKGEMKESNAKYEDRISQMRQKIRDLVASRAEKEYDIESLGKEMTDYEKNLSGKEAELKKAEYELAWQKREYDIADKKVTEGEKKKESAESAVSKLDKKITKAKTSE